jgi:excisionase family DNA binding protein
MRNRKAVESGETLDDVLLSYESAAQHCEVSKRTMMRWASEGKIPTVHLSERTVRIRRKDLLAFIESRMV